MTNWSPFGPFIKQKEKYSNLALTKCFTVNYHCSGEQWIEDNTCLESSAEAAEE